MSCYRLFHSFDGAFPDRSRVCRDESEYEITLTGLFLFGTRQSPTQVLLEPERYWLLVRTLYELGYVSNCTERGCKCKDLRWESFTVGWLVRSELRQWTAGDDQTLRGTQCFDSDTKWVRRGDLLGRVDRYSLVNACWLDWRFLLFTLVRWTNPFYCRRTLGSTMLLLLLLGLTYANVDD
jgi:hypothetical protein